MREAKGPLWSEQVQLVRKEVKLDPFLAFSNEDLARVSLPYNDALVVTLLVKGYKVRKILVDTGSAVYVIFLHSI